MSSSKKSVCMVGSGNFACAIVRNVAHNVRKHGDVFQERVRMWVHEEEVEHEGGKDDLALRHWSFFPQV